MIDYEVLRFYLVAADWHSADWFCRRRRVRHGVGMLTRFLGRNDTGASDYDQRHRPALGR